MRSSSILSNDSHCLNTLKMKLENIIQNIKKTNVYVRFDNGKDVKISGVGVSYFFSIFPFKCILWVVTVRVWIAPIMKTCPRNIQ